MSPEPRDTISVVFGRTVAVAGVAGSWLFWRGRARRSPAAQPPVPRESTRPTVESPSRPAAPSPRNASYTITARLDPASRTLTGEQLLTWRNTSTIPATSLRFHLYYNAWRNTRSTWMRESALAGDSDTVDRPEADWGWIDVTSLKLVGTGGTPVDVTSACASSLPTMGTSMTGTVAEVPLAAPVRPGEIVNVQVAWSSRVPRTFARTGAIGDFYFLAQWFPKIGVFRTRAGTAISSTPTTEFFADFGIYDVRLTVPSGWMVGATGVERGRRDEGDRTTTHHYRAEDVHDFAWTTSPDYVERIGGSSHAGLPGSQCGSCCSPSTCDRRIVISTRRARRLRYYGEWFGPYPYANIDDRRSAVAERRGRHGVSDAVHRGHAMACASHRRAAGRRDRPRSRASVLVRLVATNEFEHAWMDEGLQHVLDGTDPRAVVRTPALLQSATSVGSSHGCSTI